jgi:hypothetical protein
MFIRQLDQLRQIGQSLGPSPSIISEFGIPFDMNNRAAYITNDFTDQIHALHRNYDALDELFLSSILWNYTADNNNEWGDNWNLEDYSIFSRNQQTDPTEINSGGRGVKGFCRPYPRFITGTPIQSDFNPSKGVYSFEFEASGNIDVPTEIYVPHVQYPRGYTVQLTSGRYERNMTRQVLYVFVSTPGVVRIRISPI